MLAMTYTLQVARSGHWQVEMYIPKHHHWFRPVILAFVGAGVVYKTGPDHWFAPHAMLIESVLDIIAIGYSYYISGAGVLYQGYITSVNAPDPKITLVDAQKQWPELQLVKREDFQPIVTNEQVTEMPAFNLERYFWKTVLQMYDMDPDTQKHVDLTEERWVIQKKVFAQKPFEYVKKRGANFGLLKRKSKAKNAKFIVDRREAVALVAAGNPLPEWSPASPTPSR